MSTADLFEIHFPDPETSILEDPDISGAWYRYEDYADGEHVSLWLRKFSVIRETPHGVWLAIGYSGEPKFVLKSARKRFAYPTIELARNSFLIRKRKQIDWLSWRHDKAVKVLAAAEAHFA